MSSGSRLLTLANLLCAGLILASNSTGRAADLTLTLWITAGERKAETEFTEHQPSPEKAHPRPVFRAAPGEQLNIAWAAKHDNGQGTFKDVLVHFFAVPEERVGQTDVPRLGKKVSHEGAVTLDFKRDAEVRGEFTLQLDKPGSYMLRIETRGLLDDLKYEDYAALDLVIE